MRSTRFGADLQLRSSSSNSAARGEAPVLQIIAVVAANTATIWKRLCHSHVALRATSQQTVTISKSTVVSHRFLYLKPPSVYIYFSDLSFAFTPVM